MRRAAKVDANQTEIVDALRRVGASVQPLHMVGQGCPDLLVGYFDRNFLLECKVGKGKLTDDQKTWHGDWRGQAFIVRSPEEALAVIGAV